MAISEEKMGSGAPHGDLVVFVGSDPTCEIQLSGRTVSPKHALLRREDDLLFILDCDSDAGTYVRGRRIQPDRWQEITRDDILFVGETELRIPAWFFLGRAGARLQSSRLSLTVKSPNGEASKKLCDGIFLDAHPKTLTAIIGPSGAGKTILLNLLNGSLAPSEGSVMVTREGIDGSESSAKSYDMHKHFDRIRDLVGYVPQDDLMTPELTVRESLQYRLGLRYPSRDASVRDRLIHAACRRLGFVDRERRKDFLDRPIGSPEARRGGLSGGERKRTNIALELVTDPLILFLDEPTSGLSSVEANQVIEMLKELAETEGLTVIATIHQPSQKAFEHFDNLLVISLGGKPAYFGPASSAAEHFEALTGEPCGQRNHSEYILDLLNESLTREPILQVMDPKAELPPSIPPPLDDKEIKEAVLSCQAESSPTELVKPVYQWWTLVNRNFRVVWRDRTSLALLLGQVPIIALLLICIFYGFAKGVTPSDVFARQVYFFDQLKQPYEDQQRSVPVDMLWRDAEKLADKNPRLISEKTAGKRASIFFLLAAASVWFGMTGGCGEVVTEFHIVKREVRSYLHRSPYLAAKAFVLFLLVGVQTGLLTVMVIPALLDFPVSNLFVLWGVLWVAAAASASLGLLVSCAAPTYRFALTAVPLLLIPQLIFGGFIRPPADLPADYWAPRVVSSLTLQRWAFEASLATDTYADRGVLKQKLADRRMVKYERYGRLNIVRFSETSVVKLFFGNGANSHLARSLGWLLVWSLLLLGAGYLVLRNRLPST